MAFVVGYQLVVRRLLVVPLSLVVACSGGDDPAGADPDGGDGSGDEVTYYEHIKPIVDAKCAGCHFDGGIAPFSLTSYDQASAYAGVSQLAINERIMPPWLADDDCNDYVADASLSDAQIELFNRWVDGGAVAGDPADEGAPLEIEDVSLSRVDETISMPVEYTATQSPDDYRCFVIEWPAEHTTTQYITGYRVNPGNLAVAHHAIAFLAGADDLQTYQALDDAEPGPGYTCFGGTGGPAQEWIAAWAPGNGGYDLPPGTGIAIEPGSVIVLQMHYNSLGTEAQPDMTTIDFSLASEVEQVARVQPWAHPNWLSGNMPIPANEPDATHSFKWDATAINRGDPFLMHSVGFHMHRLGTSGKLHIRRANGDTECLLEISRWDFDWQGAYGFREPVQFNPGDELYLECHWDNTVGNQPIVDGQPLPPRDVNWGEGTTDEMCLATFLMSGVP